MQFAADIGQSVVILPSSVSQAKERNILFLCDRKACEKCSYPQCRHTPELEHDRNFAPAGFTKRTDGVWVEQEGATMEGKTDQDKLEKRLVEAMREAMGLETEKSSTHGLALGCYLPCLPMPILRKTGETVLRTLEKRRVEKEPAETLHILQRRIGRGGRRRK